MTAPLAPEEFERRLRQIGVERYHDRHPFHRLLHAGTLNRGQVQAWVLNRYYYQKLIPQKDAALIARAGDLDLRREWIGRIVDHDGRSAGEGGIERWLVLAEGVGLDRTFVRSCEGVLPGVRFACDAYLHFVRDSSTLEGIASSLTEMFAPDLHKTRIAALLEHYAFASDTTLAYFRTRLIEAPKSVGFSLAYVLREAQSREQQERCLAALRFKTDVLWAQLDALHHAYVIPAHLPPGAFIPEAS